MFHHVYYNNVSMLYGNISDLLYHVQWSGLPSAESRRRGEILCVFCCLLLIADIFAVIALFDYRRLHGVNP